MPSVLPAPVLWHGAERVPTEPLVLRAGPLTMLFEPDLAFVRYIRLGGREVLRGIYSAVRDHNWGTVTPQVSDLRLDCDDQGFRLTFDVECVHEPIDFAWRGSITGNAQGTILFSMEGIARSTFLRSRIGFCVLHPIDECAGRECRVEHVNGSVQHAHFPKHISPHQPFKDVRAIAHEVTPGVWAEARFSGDVFEMEDQRNWTDASFKTYCTPLGLPYPVEIVAGTRVTQTVELRLAGRPPSTLLRSSSDGETVLDVADRPRSRLPRIGLQVASSGQPLRSVELDRLRKLKLHRRRVEPPLHGPAWREGLARAAGQAQALGIGLEAALFLGPSPAIELDNLLAKIRTLRPPVSSWIVFHVDEASTNETWVRLARDRLSEYDPQIPLGAGTYRDFTELNRCRPLVEPLDFICYAANPQVHAFDNRSIVETLPTHQDLVETARQFAGSLPIAVTPLSLKAYAPSSLQDRAAGGSTQAALPQSVDPRQMSLFWAAWTLGSLKHLAQAGVQSVTYGETTGWRGVMETESGSHLPEVFRSLPDAVFPVYHVLADVGDWSDAQVLATSSSDSLAVEGLALERNGRRRLMVANLTGEKQVVVIPGLTAPVRVTILDETNAQGAMRAPEAFRAQTGTRVEPSGAALRLALRPYTVARLDLG